MNIIFRCDASKDIGIGHLMRCLSLSEEFIKRGHICYFASKIYDETVDNLISEKKLNLIKINPNINQKQEIDLLLNFSRKKKIDWVITDNYDISSDYIKTLKEYGLNVLSIDDNSHISYFSDIVVNQNIGSENLSYSGDRNTKYLLGTKYVILRDELLNKPKKIRNKVEKILIMFGGTDNNNLTLKILKIIKETIYNQEIIIVIGPLNPFLTEIKSYIEEEKISAKIIYSPKELADIYLDTDVAISAGGTSVYELALFGIPNIIITIANNQVRIAEELDSKNISIYTGKIEEFNEELFKEKFKELLTNDDLRKKISKNAKKLVDGKGKNRIVDLMERYN